MSNEASKWNEKAEIGDEAIIDGVHLRKASKVKERKLYKFVTQANEETLKDVPTVQIEEFLKQRREEEKVEHQYRLIVGELQQVHAFAIDEFFAQVEKINFLKTDKVFDREAFEKYAAVYKESVDGILEAYWETSPHIPAVLDKVRDFPLADEERDLRTRDEITGP